VDHPCPPDGIHRRGKDGKIKGVKSVWIDTKLVPRGSVGFYWRLDDSTGLKVYMGFPTGKKPWTSKKRMVEKAYKTMKIFHKAGFAPQPKGIQRVYVALKVDGKTIIDTPWALRMQHIHYDEKAWGAYAEGRPYRWGEYPNDAKGYLEFVLKLKDFQKEHKIKLSAASWKNDEVPKIGDVMFCHKEKRFYLVDVD